MENHIISRSSLYSESTKLLSPFTKFLWLLKHPISLTNTLTDFSVHIESVCDTRILSVMFCYFVCSGKSNILLMRCILRNVWDQFHSISLIWFWYLYLTVRVILRWFEAKRISLCLKRNDNILAAGLVLFPVISDHFYETWFGTIKFLYSIIHS